MTDDPDKDPDGNYRIRPGTIYLGKYKWWEYTSDPKKLYCTVCKTEVTNWPGAIGVHAKTHPPDKQ